MNLETKASLFPRYQNLCNRNGKLHLSPMNVCSIVFGLVAQLVRATDS